MAKCAKCGNDLRDGAKFCPKCGTGVQPVNNPPAPQKKKGKAWLIPIIVSLVALVTATAVILIFFNPFKDRNNSWEISVPDVVNNEYEKAQDTLNESYLHGLIYDKVASENAVEDNVVNQNPRAMTVVNKGSIVDLVLSAGVEKTYLPDVTGYTFDYAKELLEEAGFKVKQEQLESGKGAPNAVGKQSADSGYTEKEQEITLWVAPENELSDEKVRVPDITGMDIEEAKAELENVGLYLAVNVAQYSDDVDENKIIRQDKAAYSKANKGETVLVTVSLGREKVYVPDVTYRTEEKAKEMLSALGLEAEVKYEESKTVKKSTVLGQEPDEGTAVEKGSTVAITVSSGYEVTVPDVTGEKEEQAVEKLVNAGLAVNVVYRADDATKKGLVIEQSVSEGEKVQLGTVVTVYVSAKEDSGEEPTADNPVEPIEPVEEKPVFLEPTEDDLRNFEHYFSRLMVSEWDYDCKTADSDDVCWYVYDGLSMIGISDYFEKNEFIYGTEQPDPLSKYTYDGALYEIIPKEQFDWVAKNVFNVEPEILEEKHYDYNGAMALYYYEGNYYSFVPVGGIEVIAEYEIKSYEKQDDGTYIIICDSLYDDWGQIKDTGKDITFHAALKEVDGKRVWSLYSAKEN